MNDHKEFKESFQKSILADKELSKKIQDLKDSDMTFEQIAKMLNIPLGRVMGIC